MQQMLPEAKGYTFLTTHQIREFSKKLDVLLHNELKIIQPFADFTCVENGLVAIKGAHSPSQTWVGCVVPLTNIAEFKSPEKHKEIISTFRAVLIDNKLITA